MREHHRYVGVAAERRLADEALVEHAAERVDVGPPIDLLTGDVLGGDVVDRAHQVAVFARRCTLRDEPREAEVGEVDVVCAVGAGTRVEQDVGRLHVTMHEASCVGSIQSARQLRECANRIRDVESTEPEAPVEVTSLDVAHGDEQEVVHPPGLVDRDDVRVVDRCGQLRFTQEALAERFFVGESCRNDLERDLPLEAEVLGQVDDAHSTPAEQRFDPVAGELRTNPRVVAHVHVRFLAFDHAEL